MQKNLIKKLILIESFNWWYVTRREIVLSLTPKNIKSCFEIGAGGGENLLQLKKRNIAVSGIDIDEESVNTSISKGLNVKKMDLFKLNFTKKYDLILMMDVLEHIKNDEAALQIIKKGLKKEGHLIITVPAFNFLYSAHDKLNHHYRRYAKTELEKKLLNAGFVIEKITYWNAGLFIPSAIMKVIKSLIPNEKASDLSLLPPPLNSLLIKILRMENKLILNKIQMPFGTSIICVAKIRD